MSFLRITWKKSFIGRNRGQRSVIQSLGLRRLHHTIEHMDSPTIRGMVDKVRHLLEVEEVESIAPGAGVKKSKISRPAGK